MVWAWVARYNDVVPYTVGVFLLGIVFSSIAKTKHLSSFHDSLNMWLNIDADLILYTFLPILIFGEAMSLNWHHAQGAFAQSAYLAGPGVVIGAMLMALITHFMMPA